MSRKQKNFYLRTDIVAKFAHICDILGLKDYEGAEMAFGKWISEHETEAQKKLELFAERGVVINNPQVVDIKIFQKAEVLLAKEELTRLLDIVACGSPEYRSEIRADLAKALKRIQPVYIRSRDPELIALVKQVESQI